MASPTAEIVVKKSKSAKYIGYSICIIGFILGIYLLLSKKDWRGIVLIVLCPVLYVWHDKEFKGDSILFTASSFGLWTPKHGHKSWSDIKKIKFRHTGSGKTYTRYLDIYWSNLFEPDESINLTDINFFTWTLKRKLNRYFKPD